MPKLGSKKQILIIHGGDSFSSYGDYLNDLKESQLDYDRLLPKKTWKDAVVQLMSDTDVLMPHFPNQQNAQYAEWKIYFEKLLPFVSQNTSLIGHSLGAMFLAKYLHEHPLASPVRQLILLAGGYNDPDQDYGSFKLDSASGLDRSSEEIHLFHSRDDFVVPFSELARYQADLPSASVHVFDNRNHFLDADFPELIELLQQK